MSSRERTYTIIQRTHQNRWDTQLQRAVTGWMLDVRWEPTGTILHVFAADDKYTPDQVDTAIRAAGAKDDAIETLGS